MNRPDISKPKMHVYSMWMGGWGDWWGLSKHDHNMAALMR